MVAGEVALPEQERPAHDVRLSRRPQSAYALASCGLSSYLALPCHPDDLSEPRFLGIASFQGCPPEVLDSGRPQLPRPLEERRDVAARTREEALVCWARPVDVD